MRPGGMRRNDRAREVGQVRRSTLQRVQIPTTIRDQPLDVLLEPLQGPPKSVKQRTNGRIVAIGPRGRGFIQQLDGGLRIVTELMRRDVP